MIYGRFGSSIRSPRAISFRRCAGRRKDDPTVGFSQEWQSSFDLQAFSRSPVSMQGRCTKATMLKKFTSKHLRHSSGSLFAILVAGSSTPWLRIKPSSRPKSWLAIATPFSAKAKSARSPAQIDTRSGAFALSFSNGSTLRARRTTLCDLLIRYSAMAKPMPATVR